VTPEELLASACDLVNRPDAAMAGVWPRTAALLARQALELGIAGVWAGKQETLALGLSSMRSQLTCLPAYLDPGVAARVAYLWAALSSACHHHPYELAPTAAELMGWLDEVGQLIALMGSDVAITKVGNAFS
jgi:hypothetical protein